MENNKGYGVSDFIPVNAGDELYFSRNGSSFNVTFLYNYGFDKTIVYDSRISVINNYTVPVGTAFIRVCIKTIEISDFQIELDSISPYKPFITLEKVYESSETNKNKVNLITNKFLILNDILSKDILSKNLFNKDTFIPDSEINSVSGFEMENNKGYGVSDFIPVNAGDELYFSRNGVEFTVTYLYTYNESFQYINRPGTLIKTFTVPNGVSFIKVCVENSKISDFQIELDEITAYKPYGILKSAFDSSIDYDEEPLQTIEDYPTFLSCFLNVGCIGDSLASGVAVYKDNNGDPVVNSVNRYEYSWGKYLARMTGNTYYNWSKGGLRTDTFLSSSYATECFDGNHLCQAYIIGLCQNDNNANHGSDIGKINDIDVSDYNNNENTFYGRYGKIIQKIKEVNPKAKIFCITDPNTNVNANGYNVAIRNIVSEFNNTYVIDLQAYWNNIPFKTLLDNQKRYGHFNAVGYYLIAKIIMSYIDYIIEKNPDDFREIENIGTNYYWY